MASGFKYRVLVADDDEKLLTLTAELLSKEGYVVLTARDGFEALAELQAGVPEVVVSDLEMPRMSGFEFLAVVRQRFPAIGVIARSGEFCPIGTPEGVLADLFVQKGENSGFELLEATRELLTRLPLRTAHVRPEIAPAWIPRTPTGYIVITCLSCLRSSSIRTRDLKTGVVATAPCVHCGTEIRYRLDVTTVGEAGDPTVSESARICIDSSRQAIGESQISITESKTRMAKPRK